MKKILLSFITILVAFSLVSCKSQVTAKVDGKLNIVASLFPQYDFAKHIAGDKATVTLLLPPGVESHTFDPKPSDMTNIYNADLFLYTGDEMEPWASKLLAGVKNKNLVAVDMSKGINLIKEEEQAQEHEYDPHIWLDPTIAMKMVESISNALCEKDPENATYYKNNAAQYTIQLQKLDDDFKTVVSNGKRNTIVFGGRFAYIYFINHYGLKYETAYDSCSTEAEPSIRKMVAIIDFIKQNNIPCIYHEEFVDPKVAKSIAEQTGATPLLFSTAHNVSKDEFAKGITYIDIMRENLKNLEKGLN